MFIYGLIVGAMLAGDDRAHSSCPGGVAVQERFQHQFIRAWDKAVAEQSNQDKE